MWFVFVGVGLVLVSLAGHYVQRRLGEALAHLGASERARRIVRWAVRWLMLGFPVLMVASVAGSLALGLATLPSYDGRIGAWLLGLPFIWAVLVVVQSTPWLLAVDVVHHLVRRRRGVAAATRVRALGVLLVLGGFAIYMPVRVLVERDELRVRHHDVASAAPTTPPLRIAFLADVQQDVHTTAARAREVYALVNAAAPDLILSGGDWINSGPEHIAGAAAAAATLRSRLGTFSVRGDHEHFAYFDRHRSVAEIEQALTRHGITMLADQVRWFDHHGKRLAVIFLNYNYVVRADRAAVARLLAEAAPADYRIAVTHQLGDDLASQLEGKVDLVLGAHTHGGQINPVVGVVHVPLSRLESRFVDGRYQLGPTTVIMTAGIGYSIFPIRYASPASIEIIDLRL